jgi:hypothetical protein
MRLAPVDEFFAQTQRSVCWTRIVATAVVRRSPVRASFSAPWITPRPKWAFGKGLQIP